MPFLGLLLLTVLREVQFHYERRRHAAERIRITAAVLARTPEAAVKALTEATDKVVEPRTKPPMPIGL